MLVHSLHESLVVVALDILVSSNVGSRSQAAHSTLSISSSVGVFGLLDCTCLGSIVEKKLRGAAFAAASSTTFSGVRGTIHKLLRCQDELLASVKENIAFNGFSPTEGPAGT